MKESRQALFHDRSGEANGDNAESWYISSSTSYRNSSASLSVNNIILGSFYVLSTMSDQFLSSNKFGLCVDNAF